MVRKRARSSNKPRRPSASAPQAQRASEARTEMAGKYGWALMIALSAIVAAIFHFSLTNIADLDSFYYIRLAWIYRTRGVFDVDFPWIEYSVIKSLSSSLWYGFGVFLIPFTYFDDLVIGIRLAGTVLTVMALSLYYWVMKRCELKMPLLWPFLFFFSAANVLYQFLMTRPQLLSVALSPLLFSLLVSRSETPDRSESNDARRCVISPFLNQPCFNVVSSQFCLACGGGLDCGHRHSRAGGKKTSMESYSRGFSGSHSRLAGQTEPAWRRATALHPGCSATHGETDRPDAFARNGKFTVEFYHTFP